MHVNKGGHYARLTCCELRFANGMRRLRVRVEVEPDNKTWQRTVLSELKREALRMAGVEDEGILQREWLASDVGRCGKMRWGWAAHVWSVSGAPEDGMLWLSASETRVETYMWGAGKRSGMLTPHGGSLSWRGKLRTWRIKWKVDFSRDV